MVSANISIDKNSDLVVEQDVQQHTIPISMMLHLLPGLLALFLYLFLCRRLESAGYPSMMAWLFSVALINIPFEWGVMLLAGYNHNRRFSLEGIVLNREPMSLKSILLWSGFVFVAVLVLFTLSAPLTGWTENSLFAWVPEWFKLNDGSLGGMYPKANILLFNLLNLFVLVGGISITEEFYFRGYLLPRLKRLGIWSVVVNSLLFSLYHFTTPWALVQRAIMTLPLAYSAYRKQNLTPACSIHVLSNVINAIPGIQYLLSL